MGILILQFCLRRGRLPTKHKHPDSLMFGMVGKGTIYERLTSDMTRRMRQVNKKRTATMTKTLPGRRVRCKQTKNLHLDRADVNYGSTMSVMGHHRLLDAPYVK